MCYLDAPFVFCLEETGCYLVSSVTTTQAFQLLWWEMRQTCVLITACPNTPQRRNGAGGGKLCYLPWGTVLNGSHFCLSACLHISHSEFGEAEPTTCLKPIVPKTTQRTSPDEFQVLPTKGGHCYLHSFGWANRKMLPTKSFWLSGQRGPVIATPEHSKTLSSFMFSSSMCTAPAA